MATPLSFAALLVFGQKPQRSTAGYACTYTTTPATCPSHRGIPMPPAPPRPTACPSGLARILRTVADGTGRPRNSTAHAHRGSAGSQTRGMPIRILPPSMKHPDPRRLRRPAVADDARWHRSGVILVTWRTAHLSCRTPRPLSALPYPAGRSIPWSRRTGAPEGVRDQTGPVTQSVRAGSAADW